MNWLLWKEFRQQRLMLGVGLVLLTVPYCMPLYAIVSEQTPGQMWSAASIMSLVFSIVTIAMLSGNAIAGERADRSAEFLAYQPISRRTKLLSKAVLPLGALVVIWLPNAVAVGIGEGWKPQLFVSLTVMGVAGFCGLGVAWLVSCLQSSPTFAAASGILAPFAVAGLVGSVIYVTGMPTFPAYPIGFVVVAALTGAAGLAIGTRYYLRRVEP